MDNSCGFSQVVSSFLASISGILQQFIVSITIAVIAGLTVNFLVAWISRPRIKVREDKDRYDPTHTLHYIHVRVLNAKSRILNRAVAVDCESEVWLVNSKSGKMKESSPFKTKWARQTTVSAVPQGVDLKTGKIASALQYTPIPPAETRMNIYPGQSDAGEEGLQLDIAVKEKGQPHCLINDPQLYHEQDRTRWILDKGTYFVKVRIHYAQSKSKSVYFVLQNESEYPGDVVLRECQKAELETAERMFQ